MRPFSADEMGYAQGVGDGAERRVGVLGALDAAAVVALSRGGAVHVKMEGLDWSHSRGKGDGQQQQCVK